MIRSRNLWSEDEDCTLRREVSKQGKTLRAKIVHQSSMLISNVFPVVAQHREVKDWQAPAAALPGRNNKGLQNSE